MVKSMTVAQQQSINCFYKHLFDHSPTGSIYLSIYPPIYVSVQHYRFELYGRFFPFSPFFGFQWVERSMYSIREPFSQIEITILTSFL